MKNIITTNFSDFVNENFSEESQMSSCCKAPLMEDNSCSECGAFETFEGSGSDDIEKNLRDQRTTESLGKAVITVNLMDNDEDVIKELQDEIEAGGIEVNRSGIEMYGGEDWELTGEKSKIRQWLEYSDFAGDDIEIKDVEESN